MPSGETRAAPSSPRGPAQQPRFGLAGQVGGPEVQARFPAVDGIEDRAAVIDAVPEEDRLGQLQHQLLVAGAAELLAVDGELARAIGDEQQGPAVRLPDGVGLVGGVVGEPGAEVALDLHDPQVVGAGRAVGDGDGGASVVRREDDRIVGSAVADRAQVVALEVEPAEGGVDLGLAAQVDQGALVRGRERALGRARDDHHVLGHGHRRAAECAGAPGRRAGPSASAGSGTAGGRRRTGRPSTAS